MNTTTTKEPKNLRNYEKKHGVQTKRPYGINVLDKPDSPYWRARNGVITNTSRAPKSVR